MTLEANNRSSGASLGDEESPTIMRQGRGAYFDPAILAERRHMTRHNEKGSETCVSLPEILVGRDGFEPSTL